MPVRLGTLLNLGRAFLCKGLVNQPDDTAIMA